MIRVYGYYSCGGYKDMYLGCDVDTFEKSYFLPLLPVMQRRQSEEDLKKLPELEVLPKIGLLSQNNGYGFPQECNILFSHGGYVAIYKTLTSGQVVFAISDIPSNERDEEDRNIPFALLFLADSRQSVSLLDRVASSFCCDAKPWIPFFSSLFQYDHHYNGISFNLSSLVEKFKSVESSDFVYTHVSGRTQFLTVSSPGREEVACRQLSLNRGDIDLFLYGMSNRPPMQQSVNQKSFEKYQHVEEETSIRSDQHKNVAKREIENQLNSIEDKKGQIEDVVKTLMQTGEKDDIEILKKEIEELKKELHDYYRRQENVLAISQNTTRTKEDWWTRVPWFTPKFVSAYIALSLTVILLIQIIILIK